jgi:uncharacterized protein (TIGR02147 family)
MGVESRKILRTFAASVVVTHYLSHRDYLKALYVMRKADDESYSYLKFADDLGFSLTNTIRLVIVGKRPLSSKAAEKIALALDFHGPDRRYWLTLVKYSNARAPADRDRFLEQLMGYKHQAKPSELGAELAEYFSEWYHPVIREMTALADFSGNPEWIKEKLLFPLRLEQIKKSLALLAELGVIRYDQGLDRYIRTEQTVATESEVDSLAIVAFHQNLIQMGAQAITSVDERQRDIRAVTVSLPRSSIHILKGKIEELVAAVAAMEDPNQTGEQVMQLNVQLFPFTR